MASCLTGDPNAWGRLVDRYAGLVYSIPRRLNMRDDECDDIAQTVFVILLRRLGSLRDVESLPKWLMTTTRRECLRVIKRREALIAEPEQSGDAGASDDDRLESLERASVVHRALSTIGDRCQRLLTMLFMSEPAPEYAEVSEAIGIPIGSIGPTRARCLAKLHEALKADPAGDEALEAFLSD